MNKILVAIVTLVFLSINGAYALDLNGAKNAGMVGETPSGYLEAVGSQNGSVAALVKDINAKRRAHYKKIAKKNGTSLKAVEALAGKKAIDKTRSGHFVKVGGAWRKK